MTSSALKNQLTYSIISAGLKNKSHNYIKRCEKHLTKYSIHYKNLNKLRVGGIFSNLIQNIYMKPTANIKLTSEKPESFLLTS